MSVFSIEDETLDNAFFRKVLHTDVLQQVVVMSLNPGEEIGMETHDNTSQFIKVEEGEGLAVLDGLEFDIGPGDVVLLPAGTEHNIIANGDEPLKLYTVYSGENLHKENALQVKPPRRRKN